MFVGLSLTSVNWTVRLNTLLWGGTPLSDTRTVTLYMDDRSKFSEHPGPPVCTHSEFAGPTYENESLMCKSPVIKQKNLRNIYNN